MEDSKVLQNSSKLFTLELLHMIKDAQQQHGLRHGDYQRYRSYCSRRIRRLRKTLKFFQGEKRHFKKREVSIAHVSGSSADCRYVHFPLICAERAWAYAMQLKQEASADTRKHFRLVRKLKKALSYALQLQSLISSPSFDARTKLECQAYVAWMNGTLSFELQLWKSAAEHFKKAQVVYENLAEALPDDEKELFYNRINEFSPNLRYCTYNIGEDTNAEKLLGLRAQGLLENLDILVKQTKSECNEGIQAIEWRGRKVIVRPEKVRLFVLSVNELDKTLVKTTNPNTKIQLIEHILMECKDSIQTVKDEIKQDPKLRSLTTGQTLSSMQYLLAYLSYTRLSLTLQRNLSLVEQAKNYFQDPNQKIQNMKEGKRVRPQDLARLYEIILQNVAEMEQISTMEDDVPYQAEMHKLSLSFKAFRCYYIALTLIGIKKWREAVALYERSLNYANQALYNEAISVISLDSELKKLIAIIDGCKFSAHAYSVLESDLSDENCLMYTKFNKSVVPLYEQLSQYREDNSLNSKTPNVFILAPDLMPISCKPHFFDLALNYLQLPHLLYDRTKSPGKNNASISGFVKGFLGWGSNK